MRLTLLRHAPAVDRSDWAGDDSTRPLTPEGGRKAQRILRLVRPLVRATAIWTSPMLRARATAELAAEAWRLPLREQPWLAAGAAAPDAWLRHLPADGELVLVGHEPDLGRIAGLLLGGPAASLRKTGLLVLEGDPRPARMAPLLMLTPKAVLALGDG